jgi:hypothetical protein
MADKRVDVYMANESFAYEGDDGRPFTFIKAVTRVAADHPARKANPQYFDPIDTDHVHYEVEAATKAPGEKRGA